MQDNFRLFSAAARGILVPMKKGAGTFAASVSITPHMSPHDVPEVVESAATVQANTLHTAFLIVGMQTLGVLCSAATA